MHSAVHSLQQQNIKNDPSGLFIWMLEANVAITREKEAGHTGGSVL
jgi:hypothetical protein